MAYMVSQPARRATRRPYMGDVTSSVLAVANSSPIGVVTNPVSTIVKAISGLFGSGDTSPFQDSMIQALAKLAAQGPGYEWAWQWLAGESGRYGAVAVNGGRMAHYAQFGAMAAPLVGESAPGGDVQQWAVGGASNWNGNDGAAGPTVRTGSQDLAWAALTKLGQAYNVAIPAPNQYSTNSPGKVANGGNPTIWTPVLSGASTGSSNPAIAANLFATPQLSPSTPPGQSGNLTAIARSTMPLTSASLGGMPLLLVAGVGVGLLLLKRKRG